MLICTLWVIIVYRSTVVIFLTSDSRNKKCGTRYLIIWILKDIYFFCYPVTFLNNCQSQNAQYYRYFLLYMVINKYVTPLEKKRKCLSWHRYDIISYTVPVQYIMLFTLFLFLGVYKKTVVSFVIPFDTLFCFEV